MQHFLVTKFNLRIEGWETTRDGYPVLTEHWLKNRFYLFENYCLPSVINQTNQNFIWFVFFDINTPNTYRDRINNISNNFTCFHPIFIDRGIKLIDSLIDNIKKTISKVDDYIITTRLDNDDLIHKDFIKVIQDLYKPIDKAIIDLRKGYQVTLGQKYSEIRVRVNYFNPFISLIEKTNNISTVLSRLHKEWKSSDFIIKSETEKLWVELVHQENKSNYTKKSLKRTFRINKLDFGLTNQSGFKERTISVFLTRLKIDLIRIFNRIFWPVKE